SFVLASISRVFTLLFLLSSAALFRSMKQFFLLGDFLQQFVVVQVGVGLFDLDRIGNVLERLGRHGPQAAADIVFKRAFRVVGGLDRKSTRLNSSHVKTSYAVFCLKKK